MGTSFNYHSFSSTGIGREVNLEVWDVPDSALTAFIAVEENRNACDVVCLVYDVSSKPSLERISTLFDDESLKPWRDLGKSFVLVGSKSDLEGGAQER